MHSKQVSCQGGRAGSCRHCREKEPCSGIPGAALGWRLLCHAAEIEIFAMAPTDFLSTPSCVGFFCNNSASEGFVSFQLYTRG